MSYGKNGYEPGKGRTFTPSQQAAWCEAFNQLLSEYQGKGVPISRNKLTEKLLEDGLRSQSPSFFQQSDRDSVLTIPLSGFSPAEVALLQSKQGQRILYNVLQLLLGQALGESFSSMPGAREQKSEGGQATERKPEEVPSSYTLDAPASTVNERKQVAPVSTRDVLEKLRRKRHLLHPN